MYGNNKIFRYKLVIFIRGTLLHTNHLRKKQKALCRMHRVINTYSCCGLAFLLTFYFQIHILETVDLENKLKIISESKLK